MIPYNSSSVTGGQTYGQAAPLRFGPLFDLDSGFQPCCSASSCAGDLTAPADCIGTSFASDPDLVRCISDQGFTWGFSLFLLVVSLVLHLAWTVGLYAIWADANRRSVFLKHKRRANGVFRSAVDLGGVMTEDLGENLGAYPNHEMEGALEVRGDIEWRVEGKETSAIPRISISLKLPTSRKTVTHEDTLYGYRYLPPT